MFLSSAGVLLNLCTVQLYCRYYTSFFLVCQYIFVEMPTSKSFTCNLHKFVATKPSRKYSQKLQTGIFRCKLS